MRSEAHTESAGPKSGCRETLGGVLAQSTIQGNESGLIFGENGADPDADTLLEGDLSFELSRIFTRKPTVDVQNRLLCLRDPRAEKRHD